MEILQGSEFRLFPLKVLEQGFPEGLAQSRGKKHAPGLGAFPAVLDPGTTC